MFCQHAVAAGCPDDLPTLAQTHPEERHQSWWSAGGHAFVTLVHWTLVRPDHVPIAQPASA